MRTFQDLPRLHPVKRAALVRRIEVGWQDRALCAKFPADDWFPAPADSEAVAEVVEVCARCPVRVSCLAAALVTGEEHGIWGGATEAGRWQARVDLSARQPVPDVLDQLLQPSPEAKGEAA
jgi:WhiB family transcriptional regulator, redox-sensing transcriptional regulator